MSPFWSPIVEHLSPYIPGEQPKMTNLVKLNTNENPYGPSPLAIEAIHRAADDALRLYPDPDATAIKRAVADLHAAHNITEANLFVGNGSDEVLAHVFMGLLKHPSPIFYPDITYSFYPTYCDLYQIDARQIPVASDFTINIGDYLHPHEKCGGVVFPNPNAPTGILLPLDAIATLAAGRPECVIVVDEAYIDFGGESAISLVQRFPNLLVVQTLSKSYALAGARIGFAVGHPDLITALDRVKNSFNSYPIDRLAIAAGAAALRDQPYLQKLCRSVIDTRNRLNDGLHALGYEVLPSSANFVFARHAQRDAAQTALHLREQGVIVRHFSRARIDQFLRITIGTDEQCDTLLAALRTAPAATAAPVSAAQGRDPGQHRV